MHSTNFINQVIIKLHRKTIKQKQRQRARFRPHRSNSKMRPSAADGVAWCVCLYVLAVDLVLEPAKTAGPTEMLFGR